MPRSLSDQFSFGLDIFDWSPQKIKTMMLNVQPLNLSICASAKTAWGWICWTVKTFCCVGSEGTDLVFFGLSVDACTWLTIQDSTDILYTNGDELKNLDKTRSSSLAGMFSIPLDSFSDSQKFLPYAFKSLLVLYRKISQFRLHLCS